MKKTTSLNIEEWERGSE